MQSKYSGNPISRTLDFSKTPITRTKSCFPWTCFTVILPPIFRTPDFSNQFSFTLEVREIGIPLQFYIQPCVIHWYIGQVICATFSCNLSRKIVALQVGKRCCAYYHPCCMLRELDVVHLSHPRHSNIVPISPNTVPIRGKSC